MKINNSIMRLIASKCIYDIMFIYVLSTLYPYEVYQVNIVPYKIVISWIFCVVLYMMVPIKSDSVKSVFYHTQFVITILPISTVYAYSFVSNDTYMIIIFFTIIIEAIILRIKIYDTVQINNQLPRFGKKVVFYSLLIGIIGVVILLIRYIGIHGLELFSPENVYDVRDDNIGRLPSWLDYLAKYAYYLIIPILLIKQIEKKKWILAIILVGLDIAIYLCMAHKTIYLMLIVVFATYIGIKTGKLIELEYLGINALMIIAGVMLKGLQFLEPISTKISLLITSFVGDRFIFGPAVNKFAYYAVFKDEPFLLFSDGRIGRLFGLTYPYGSLAPGNLAYQYCFESGMSNSITGYLGDAYMQLGVIGMFLTAVILALLIRFFEKSSERRVPLYIVIVVVNCYTVCMNDCPLHTMILSTGLGLFILYCFWGERSLKKYKL